MKYVQRMLLLLAVLLVPGLAFGANTLNPVGEDGWTYYVMGNGEAIYNVLNAIKLFMTSSTFTTVVLIMATLGVAASGLMAGYQSSKVVNFIMFFVSTWIVTLVSQTLTSTVLIHDPVNNYYNAVTGVPAIVAVPASSISMVGHWMTESIETYYNLPGSLSLSQGGQYNLVGRMLADAHKQVITNPDLKRSISSYITDCGIPAIARGNISMNTIRTSTDVWASFKFDHISILTRYYTSAPPAEGTTDAQVIDGVPVNKVAGELVNCTTAWQRINEDLSLHATELLHGNAVAWSSTGVMSPVENMMNSSLSWVGGTSYGGSPGGYIKQTAMLNSLQGTFRDAAMMTKNNEMLMAGAIAQAEHQQKTAWVTAGEVFNNMMGYVYTVLQAFIFAIVPIVIIMLMIPGFGLKVLINYGQVLVWLALWEPFLSVINYLVAIFAKNNMGSIYTAQGGLTMASNFAVSEQANNLIIAATFLGTMVPMITWGIVKGSMAFTEFISHGIGSSFATQAGATAATGNMSLGNISMDNIGMNKINTATQTSVGSQGTTGFDGAGQGTYSATQGGDSFTRHAQNITRTGNVADAASLTKSGGSTSSSGDSASLQRQATKSLASLDAESQGMATSMAHAVGKLKAVADSGGTQGEAAAAILVSMGFDKKVDAHTAKTEGAGLSGGTGMNLGGAGGKGGKGGSKTSWLPGINAKAEFSNMDTNIAKIGGGIDQETRDTLSAAKKYVSGRTGTVTGSDGSTWSQVLSSAHQIQVARQANLSDTATEGTNIANTNNIGVTGNLTQSQGITTNMPLSASGVAMQPGLAGGVVPDVVDLLTGTRDKVAAGQNLVGGAVAGAREDTQKTINNAEAAGNPIVKEISDGRAGLGNPAAGAQSLINNGRAMTENGPTPVSAGQVRAKQQDLNKNVEALVNNISGNIDADPTNPMNVLKGPIGSGSSPTNAPFFERNAGVGSVVLAGGDVLSKVLPAAVDAGATWAAGSALTGGGLAAVGTTGLGAGVTGGLLGVGTLGIAAGWAGWEAGSSAMNTEAGRALAEFGGQALYDRFGTSLLPENLAQTFVPAAFR